MSDEGRLKIYLSPAALASLEEIWTWNATRYGDTHANRYIEFLLDETEKLTHGSKSTFFDRPGIQHVLLRRGRRGHGHVVVFKRRDGAMEIIDYYHSAQNWQDKLS